MGLLQRLASVLLMGWPLWAAGVACAAEEGGLAEARGLLLAGKYAEAEEVYRPLVERDPAAALGLARCLRETGKADEAAAVLGKAAGDHALLHAELARLAFERGDYPAAQKHADRAIALKDDQLLARWIRGELSRVTGRLEKADLAYRWLIRYYNGHDVEDAESLRWIGLAAARYARWNRLDDQFSFLVNELYPDALKLDPAYWPAHYEAGLLYLEKYNQGDAARELRAALEQNPHSADVLAALARLAVAERDLQEAEELLDRALKVNPQLLEAIQGKADLAWANFEPRETLDLLREKALPLNPVSETTLGRIAACYLVLDVPVGRGTSERLEKLFAEVTGRNPHAGEFFYTLAGQLEDRNKLGQAERFYRRAIEVMPQLLGPRSQLAMLQMRTGDEAAARTMLEQAFDADPFNVRVHNMLEVLDVLDGMETLDTGSVLLRYDGEQDELLARYAAKYLDENYDRWCREFGYRPPGKPLVEIFNTARGVPGQQWFSTRLIGLPYLGVVAASTGRVVAMTSPNELQGRREFNWARVMRHEFVHVITLQQTDFNIPHWYTEGLAVYLEGGPRPQQWNEALLKRVPVGAVFTLDTINFGFTRPKSSDDWTMAYCQAELYVEYVLKRWGRGWLRKLLGAYAEGLTTAEAIPRVFGISEEAFERGYREYLEGIVNGLSSLDWPEPGRFDELLKSHRDDPNDGQVAAELAYAYLLRGADDEARSTAEKAVKLVPKQQLATYVLARLKVKAEDFDGATRLLEDALNEDSPQPNALNLLAALRLKEKKYGEAERLYGLGERLDPVNLRWTKALARVHLLAGNRDKLVEALTRLARADPDDLNYNKKLAQLALQRNDYPAAAGWANRAIQVNVMDGQVHRMAGQALVGLKDYGAAIEEFQTAVELTPDDPQPRFALADAYLQNGQPAEAREVLEALLERVPDYPGADVLLESLEEPEKPDDS